MLRSSLIFLKEWCTFDRKKCLKQKKIVHSKGLNVINVQRDFWFASKFGPIEILQLMQLVPKEIISKL
jgi:hypothetical protein